MGYTESPLADDCTGGAEHVHGDTVKQTPLVSVLTDPPTTPLLLKILRWVITPVHILFHILMFYLTAKPRQGHPT